MVQMVFRELSHIFHKQFTNVSQHVFVILLWGILTSPLTFKTFTFGTNLRVLPRSGTLFREVGLPIAVDILNRKLELKRCCQFPEIVKDISGRGSKSSEW